MFYSLTVKDATKIAVMTAQIFELFDSSIPDTMLLSQVAHCCRDTANRRKSEYPCSNLPGFMKSSGHLRDAHATYHWYTALVRACRGTGTRLP
jgi:hypothetical protein